METPSEAPPVLGPPPSTGHEKQKKGGIIGLLSAIGILLLNFGKILFVSLKFLKLGAILQTGGSMLIMAWVYSIALGWPFAVGFVVTILVHEMGHVLAAKMYRVPVSAPMFIPFMGALIMKKTPAPTMFAEAVIAIAGPIAGGFAGLVCWAVYMSTQSPLWLGLAHVAFLMNLFNLCPVFPMDGGRVMGAVSKWFLIPGMLILGGLYVSGFLHNPMILVLIIMALPSVFHSFKGGSLVGDLPPTSPAEKLVISVAYVSLAATLAWAMGMTDTRIRTHTTGPHLASVERRQSLETLNVSPSRISPDSQPFMNQRTRWADVPWVNESGCT